MLRIRTAFLTVSIALSVLWLFSFAHATRSRLMGMGDLSIVIEDESNMINLWDFGGNPAGFLVDEKGSTARADMLRKVYEIQDIECYYFVPHLRFPIWYRCNAEGGSFKGNMSISLRKNNRYALGLEGNYFYRDRKSPNARDELKYPEVSFVLSKNLGSLASIGAYMQYKQYATEMSFEPTCSFKTLKTKCLRTDVGLGRRHSDMMTLALLLGYESLDSGEEFYLSDFYTLRASAQGIVEIENKLNLGFEVIGHVRRADFKYEYNGADDYYYSRFRIRAIYRLTSRARLGIFYSDKELFSGYHYPLESFTYPTDPEALTFTHLGIGCAYDFAERILAGLEYHFMDSSTPNSSDPTHGLMHWSSNLGVEGRLTQAWSVRTGYIWSQSTENPPVFVGARDRTGEHVLTFGTGYSPDRSGLCFEISYRYALKKFKEWYFEASKYRPVESDRHSFSASFKMSL